MDMMTEPVGLIRRGAETGEFDDYGNPVYTPPSTALVYGWVEFAESSEDDTVGEQRTQGYLVAMPTGTDVEAVDSVILHGDVAEIVADDGTVLRADLVGGETYRVVGEPQIQAGGFILPGYVRIRASRVEG